MRNLHKKFLVFFLIGMLTTYVGVTKFAVAEDDDDRYEDSEDEREDEEDEEDDEDDEEEEEEEEEKTITQIIRLPDKYITKTIIENIIKKDTDRDGLLDENDPHPNIAEIYIVNDSNKNGIDDKYDL